MATDERIHTLDILRGFALLGMILVHFHQGMRIEVEGWQDLIGWFVYIFVEQKAWATFAFLFGVGFAILLRRLEAKQAAVVPIYLRRLAALAVFGIIAEVFFGFHILFSYACWGLALLVVRRWSTRALLVTAVLAVMVRPIAVESIAIWSWLQGAPFPANPTIALSKAVKLAEEQDQYLPLLVARWNALAAYPSWRALLPDMNLALFIVGMLAVRHGILDAPLKHARTIRLWMIGGALSWALAWTVSPFIPSVPIPGANYPIATVLGLVEDQWLCFFYIGAGVLLLARFPDWVSRLKPVGQAGRMALTNYLLQAAVLDILGSGYGFKLRLAPAAYVAATLALFSAEVVLSTMWLSRFRYGPFERLWRVITYWRGTSS